MKNLKDNIWIEGFDIHEVGCLMRTKDGNFIGDVAKEIVYSGNTSDIPEEIAEECVELLNSGHIDYEHPNQRPLADYTNEFSCNTAKESIQSACYKPYCIIFKK